MSGKNKSFALAKFTGTNKTGSREYRDIRLPVTRSLCFMCEGFSSEEDPCRTCDSMRVIEEIYEEMCKKRLSWWKGMIRVKNKWRLFEDFSLERNEDWQLWGN